MHTNPASGCAYIFISPPPPPPSLPNLIKTRLCRAHNQHSIGRICCLCPCLSMRLFTRASAHGKCLFVKQQIIAIMGHCGVKVELSSCNNNLIHEKHHTDQAAATANYV